jgi:hypothetical protein
MLARLGGLVVVVAVAALGCGRRGGTGGDGGVVGPGFDAAPGHDALGDCGSFNGGCTQMGCPAVTGMSGSSELVVGLAIPIAAPMGDLPGSEVMGCRNGACVTGTLLSPQQSPSGWNWVEFPANDSHIEANVRDPVADAGPVLEVGWGRNSNVSPWCLLPDPQDGDRYAVELRTPTSVVVAAASGTATYTVRYPNGPCCTPACCSGAFTMTPDAGTDQ